MFSLELFLLFLELVYGRVEIPLGIPDPCESGLWRFSGVLPWLECWECTMPSIRLRESDNSGREQWPDALADSPFPGINVCQD